MGILRDLFKGKQKKEQNIDVEQKKRTLDDVLFKRNEIDIDKVFDQLINGEITQEEYEQIRSNNIPFCRFKDLEDSNIKLYRIGKSSVDISEKSIEKQRFIKQTENTVAEDIYHSNGLSMSGDAIITCLAYGDLLIEISFDKENIEKYNLQNEKLKQIGGQFDEYTANKIYINKIRSLEDIKTLKLIIDVSSDVAFEKMLITKSDDSISPNFNLKKYGFNSALKYWETIQDRYRELCALNVENKIGILRSELDKIMQTIPNTEFYNGKSDTLNESNLTIRNDITNNIDRESTEEER